MKMDKNELVIKIDLKPIYKDIEKYIKPAVPIISA